MDPHPVGHVGPGELRGSGRAPDALAAAGNGHSVRVEPCAVEGGLLVHQLFADGVVARRGLVARLSGGDRRVDDECLHGAGLAVDPGALLAESDLDPGVGGVERVEKVVVHEDVVLLPFARPAEGLAEGATGEPPPAFPFGRDLHRARDGPLGGSACGGELGLALRLALPLLRGEVLGAGHQVRFLGRGRRQGLATAKGCPLRRFGSGPADLLPTHPGIGSGIGGHRSPIVGRLRLRRSTTEEIRLPLHPTRNEEEKGGGQGQVEGANCHLSIRKGSQRHGFLPRVRQPKS